MSIKVRITAWITLMVLLLAAMTLVFVLVINHNAITDDPAGRLVNVVQENVKDVEFDRGKFEWDDLSMYSGGVYSQFYSTDGALLHGALPEDFDPDLAFSPNIVRTVSSGGRNYFVYDSYVDMDVTGLWVRGIISSDDRSGVMHTITVLTATLLPILLAVTIGGGWLIAWSAMRPVEKILAAVDGISAGEDLSARLNMQRGPREMRRLSAAFDRMFARLEKASTPSGSSHPTPRTSCARPSRSFWPNATAQNARHTHATTFWSPSASSSSRASICRSSCRRCLG